MVHWIAFPLKSTKLIKAQLLKPFGYKRGEKCPLRNFCLSCQTGVDKTVKNIVTSANLPFFMAGTEKKGVALKNLQFFGERPSDLCQYREGESC